MKRSKKDLVKEYQDGSKIVSMNLIKVRLVLKYLVLGLYLFSIKLSRNLKRIFVFHKG
jgi:hypothetical protein